MITLEQFIELYKPEFETDDVDVKLYTVVKVGDITKTTSLGTFRVEHGKIKNIDMKKMIVEKFTIPNRAKPNDSITCMEITVSDNPQMHLRERGYGSTKIKSTN